MSNMQNGLQNMTFGSALAVVLLWILFKIDPGLVMNDMQAMAFAVVIGGIVHKIDGIIDSRWPPRKTIQPATEPQGEPS